MSTPIAFVICTEPGNLEKQSLLLVRSLREFGGSLKNTPVYSFHPRLGANISKQTLKSFEVLEVCHQQIILNYKYPLYGVANKPLVCAYAEEKIDAEVLVFLDSDQCFFSEPKKLLLPQSYDIAIRPEDLNLIGSKGKDDPNEDYWQKLYEICQVKSEIFISTTVDNQKIRAYWNSGMVAARRSKGFFTSWKKNFETVMDIQLKPKRGLFFVEQSVLSATICSLTDAILTLPQEYNYPLNMHYRMPKNKKIRDLDNIVTIHYHKLFREEHEEGLKKLDLQKTSSKYQWLYKSLLNQKIQTKKLEFYKIKMKRNLYSLIKSLGLNKILEKLLNRPLP